MADYSNFTDTELFTRMANDDQKAFEAIYHRHFFNLLNTAYRRLHSKDDAVEIVQDVFTQLYLSRNSIRDYQNLAGYLHTLVRNKIIDAYRHKLYRSRQLAAANEFQEKMELSPDHQLDGKYLETRIQQVIKSLPDKCREVFLLSRINQLSHRSISEKLNISVSTVEKHIVKAIKIMREQILCIVLSSGLMAACL
jgi:RNA polymerase sigma-70 factor (family 1)